MLPTGDPRDTKTNGAEFVAVDKYGNIYGGEPGPRKLQKYVRVRPLEAQFEGSSKLFLT